MGQLCSSSANADFTNLTDLQRELARSGVLEDLELMVGVDASKSNEILGVTSFGGRCLHDTSDGAPENPYMSVMRAATKLFERAGADSALPLYYFGSEQAQKAPGGLLYVKECRGQSDLVSAYRKSIGSQTLSGQTSLVPLIREACRRVRESGKYHILLIITDGAVLDEAEHVACLNDASTCALSIVCAGVGDGPFDAMERFDDQIPRERLFDNFQFVEFAAFNKINALMPHDDDGVAPSPASPSRVERLQAQEKEEKEDAFFFHALMEVPRQYKAICEKLGYQPKRIGGSSHGGSSNSSGGGGGGGRAALPARLSVSVIPTTSQPLYASSFSDFDTKMPLLAAPHGTGLDGAAPSLSAGVPSRKASASVSRASAAVAEQPAAALAAAAGAPSAAPADAVPQQHMADAKTAAAAAAPADPRVAELAAARRDAIAADAKGDFKGAVTHLQRSIALADALAATAAAAAPGTISPQQHAALAVDQAVLNNHLAVAYAKAGGGASGRTNSIAALQRAVDVFSATFGATSIQLTPYLTNLHAAYLNTQQHAQARAVQKHLDGLDSAPGPERDWHPLLVKRARSRLNTKLEQCIGTMVQGVAASATGQGSSKALAAADEVVALLGASSTSSTAAAPKPAKVGDPKPKGAAAVAAAKAAVAAASVGAAAAADAKADAPKPADADAKVATVDADAAVPASGASASGSGSGVSKSKAKRAKAKAKAAAAAATAPAAAAPTAPSKADAPSSTGSAEDDVASVPDDLRVDALVHAARTYRAVDRPEDALSAAEASLAFQDTPGRPLLKYNLFEPAATLSVLAQCHADASAYDRALPLLQRACASLADRAPASTQRADTHLLYVHTLRAAPPAHGGSSAEQTRTEAKAALALAEAAHGATKPRTADFWELYAACCLDAGALSDAEAAAKRALIIGKLNAQPLAAGAATTCATAQMRSGRHADALKTARDALDAWKALHPKLRLSKAALQRASGGGGSLLDDDGLTGSSGDAAQQTLVALTVLVSDLEAKTKAAAAAATATATPAAAK